MKNSVEITRGYQVGYMIRRHVFSAFVCFIFQCVGFASFFNNGILQNIIGGVFAAVYLIMMYLGAWRMGKNDAKGYTPLKCECKWSLLWAVILVAINIVLCVAYKYIWTYKITADGIPPIGTIIVNLIFYFWNAPYIAFIQNGGEIFGYVLAMMIGLPVIGIVFGYFMGSKKIAIIDKIMEFKFEKDENEK